MINIIETIQEIMALAIHLSETGKRQVFAVYSGHVHALYVRVFAPGADWSDAGEQTAEYKEDVHLGWDEGAGERLVAARNYLESLMTGEATNELARHQPCGCIVCKCEDKEQCQGCGAKNCGSHPVGEIPNPAFEIPEVTL